MVNKEDILKKLAQEYKTRDNFCKANQNENMTKSVQLDMEKITHITTSLEQMDDVAISQLSESMNAFMDSDNEVEIERLIDKLATQLDNLGQISKSPNGEIKNTMQKQLQSEYDKFWDIYKGKNKNIIISEDQFSDLKNHILAIKAMQESLKNTSEDNLSNLSDLSKSIDALINSGNKLLVQFKEPELTSIQAIHPSPTESTISTTNKLVSSALKDLAEALETSNSKIDRSDLNEVKQVISNLNNNTITVSRKDWPLVQELITNCKQGIKDGSASLVSLLKDVANYLKPSSVKSTLAAFKETMQDIRSVNVSISKNTLSDSKGKDNENNPEMKI